MNEGTGGGRFWLALALLVAGAALVRGVVFGQWHEGYPWAEHPPIDGAAYDAWAHRILEGRGAEGGVFFQAPLYAYLLAGLHFMTGGGLEAVRVAQMGLGLAVGVLAALMGRRVAGPRAGLVAGALTLFSAPLILQEQAVLKTTCTVAALLATAWAYSTHRRLLTGLGLGAALLLQGNAALAALAILVCQTFQGPGRLRRWAPVVGGIALVLVPVLVRNRVVGGEWVVTTSQAGTNLYGGNSVHNPWGTPRGFPWVRGIPAFEAGDWAREAERRTGRDLGAAEVSRFWLAEVRREAGWERLGRKARLAVGAYEVPDNHSLDYARRFVPALEWTVPSGVLVGCALAGLALLGFWPGHMRRRARRMAWPAAGWFATLILGVMSSRLRAPLLPFMAVAAGAGFEAMAACWSAGGWRRPAAAALAALGLAVPWVVVPSGMAESDEDHRLLQHALLEMQQRGYPSITDGLLGVLEDRHPGDPHIDLARAEWLAGEGRREEALALALRVIQRAPGPALAFRAHQLAGMAALLEGKDRQAADLLEAALQFDPGHLEIRVRRDTAWFHLGRTDQALRDVEGLVFEHPDFWLGWDLAAQILLHLDREDDARRCAERVQALGGLLSPPLQPLLEG